MICLRKRFGLDAQQDTQDTRIIILEINDNMVGFIVDAVTETLRLAEEAIEPPHPALPGCAPITWRVWASSTIAC